MKIFIYEKNKYWYPITEDTDISYKNSTFLYKNKEIIKTLELESRLKIEGLDESGDYVKLVMTVIPSDFESEFTADDPFGETVTTSLKDIRFSTRTIKKLISDASLEDVEEIFKGSDLFQKLEQQKQEAEKKEQEEVAKKEKEEKLKQQKEERLERHQEQRVMQQQNMIKIKELDDQISKLYFASFPTFFSCSCLCFIPILHIGNIKNSAETLEQKEQAIQQMKKWLFIYYAPLLFNLIILLFL